MRSALALFLVAAVPQDPVPALRGAVRGGDTNAPVVVRVLRPRIGAGGRPLPFAAEQVYAPHGVRDLRLDRPGEFQFQDLEPGAYGVIAFQDRDGDGALGFDPPEPFGWAAAEPGGPVAVLAVQRGTATAVTIDLRTPTPPPRDPVHAGAATLTRMRGIPVLQLRGTRAERGHAHGRLLARQILDFFEFFVIEEMEESAARYEREWVPFLESRFREIPAYRAELDAVLQGMRASGVDLRVPCLGREFRRVDLEAINAYVEKRARSAAACSQFAFWGPRTEGGTLAGQLVVGRNMDAEIDLRKVTVSHFLLIASDPAEPGLRRHVSCMWPGFVGTLSGVNEDGLYAMENAGQTRPGPVVGGLVPVSWVMRHALETLGGDTTPAAVRGAIEAFRSDGGGGVAPGGSIVWAMPFRGQQAPAFVYEGDRFGGALRLPTEGAPRDPHALLATNHFLVYGADPTRPGTVFGKEPAFSSRWRFETGVQQMQALARLRRPVDVATVQGLLRSVCHGTTEHALVFLPESRRLFVAVDDLAADAWDAPWHPWAEFTLAELFARP
ncbi:MAG: DUF2141 domain-containing protein [Planctomycetes bacterium]|nr:DUF2141 domain-containing protein [Planctomycetota bacterium]